MVSMAALILGSIITSDPLGLPSSPRERTGAFKRVAETLQIRNMVGSVVEPNLQMIGLVGADEGVEHGRVLFVATTA
jgi:hypothetical protein